MYGAYITYSQLNEYLPYVIENNLVERREGTDLYRLTEKGYILLSKCRGLDGFTSIRDYPESRRTKKDQIFVKK